MTADSGHASPTSGAQGDRTVAAMAGNSPNLSQSSSSGEQAKPAMSPSQTYTLQLSAAEASGSPCSGSSDSADDREREVVVEPQAMSRLLMDHYQAVVASLSRRVPTAPEETVGSFLDHAQEVAVTQPGRETRQPEDCLLLQEQQQLADSVSGSQDASLLHFTLSSSQYLREKRSPSRKRSLEPAVVRRSSRLPRAALVSAKTTQRFMECLVQFRKVWRPIEEIDLADLALQTPCSSVVGLQVIAVSCRIVPPPRIRSDRSASDSSTRPRPLL
jgi:hypothetical protein